MTEIKNLNNGIKEENLKKLHHDFVCGFNGECWCVWTCIEDFRKGFAPYEGELLYHNGIRKYNKFLTIDDAINFTQRYHYSTMRNV